MVQATRTGFRPVASCKDDRMATHISNPVNCQATSHDSSSVDAAPELLIRAKWYWMTQMNLDPEAAKKAQKIISQLSEIVRTILCL